MLDFAIASPILFYLLFFPPISLYTQATAIPDAPFTFKDAVYRNAINFPRGNKNQSGGIVLLVHGSATTSVDAWGKSPYNEKMSSMSPGYDICWIDLPYKGMGDLQLAAEFVAFGIRYLSALSPGSGFRINVIGHSQGGGANIQWALTFWPSIQKLVVNYFSLAGTFKGTDEAILSCGAEILLGGCLPGALQISTRSHYMAVQNSKADDFSGAQAHVNTTSIYSIYDEVMQFEGYGGRVNSYLEGATMVKLQDKRVCGKGHIVGHMGIMHDPAAFGIIYGIMSEGRQFDIGAGFFDKSSCQHLKQIWWTALSNWKNVLTVIKNFAIGPHRFKMIWTEYRHLRVPKEPGLRHYVCERGYAKQCLLPGAAFAEPMVLI